MHVAIVPVIEKMLMSGKVNSSGMFNDQNTIGFQYVLTEYQSGDFFDIRHIVRRISKNDVKLRFADRQKMENIVANDTNLTKT